VRRIKWAENVVADESRRFLRHSRFRNQRIDELVELPIDGDGAKNEGVFGVCQIASSVSTRSVRRPDMPMLPIDWRNRSMTERSNDPQTSVPACYRHSDRVTRLQCSQCGRPICTECSTDAAVGQRCPECVRSQGTTRVIRGRNLVGNPTFQTSPVSFSIIAITVTIFVLGLVSPEAQNELFQRLAMANFLVEAGDWWRVLTVTLLHGSLAHIFFNMYALYIFGPRLEQQVGSLPFAALWLASAAGGSAASFFFGEPDQVAVGASGAIFGLFGAWLYVAWVRRDTPAGRAQLRTFGWLLAINMALPLFIRNIDWRAHLGGLVTGVIVAALWRYFAAAKPNAEQRRSALAAMVFVILMALIVLV